MTEQPKTFPNVQGRCPACGNSTLFVGTGGWLTCSLDVCPNPSAADELLHGEPASAPAAATQATEPGTCGHTIDGGFGRPLGPCLHPPRHPELFHRDANGTEWRPTRAIGQPDTTASLGARQEYEAAIECAIGLNVNCGGTAGVHRVRDAVLAARDSHLDELADRHRRLGIELEHWQTVIVPDLRNERDRLARTLREVLAILLPTKNDYGIVVGYEPPYPITPAVIARWRATLPECACTCGEPAGDDEESAEVRKGWLHSRSCAAVKEQPGV